MEFLLSVVFGVFSYYALDEFTAFSDTFCTVSGWLVGLLSLYIFNKIDEHKENCNAREETQRLNKRPASGG